MYGAAAGDDKVGYLLERKAGVAEEPGTAQVQ